MPTRCSGAKPRRLTEEIFLTKNHLIITGQIRLFYPFEGMGILGQPRPAEAGENQESALNSINQFAENLNCHGKCREEPSVVWCDGQGRYIAATTRSPMAVQETFFIPVSKISAVR